MQNRPPRRSEWKPSSIHSRAVSTITSAPVEQEAEVAGDAHVVEERVGDVRVDVVLRGAGGVPRGRLLAVDRAPREPRRTMSDLARPGAGGLQHPAAEVEHLARPVRVRVDEERDDVDLGVPEVLALVAAAGHPFGGDAEALVAGGRLHQREEVEADGLLDLRRALDLDVAAPPELGDVTSVPASTARGRPPRPGRACGRRAREVARVRPRRPVVGGELGQPQRLPGLELGEHDHLRGS